MLVRRAEIKDIEKINELLLQVAMVHHYGRPDLFRRQPSDIRCRR